MVKITSINADTNDQSLECGSQSTLAQDDLSLPASLPSPAVGMVIHKPVKNKVSISSPVMSSLSTTVSPLKPSFSFPEAPTTGEHFLLDLQSNHRYKQVKENLTSPPITPITFTDL